MFSKPSKLMCLAAVTILVGGIAQAADPDLVGWWKLDEGSGTLVTDSSGHGLEGTITGGAWVTPGWHGGGFCLELSNDGYVDLGNPASLNFGTGDWAITAWVKNNMTGTGDANKGTIYADGGDNSGGHRYTLAISEITEGVITLTTDDNATKLQATATTLVNDGEWHFVVGMRSGTSILVYTDGQEEGSNTGVPAAYDLSGTSQHDAYLGAITANDTSSLFKTYDGLIDDVRVFKKALSQAEIDFIMQDIGATETAYDAVPSDEATDIPRDIVLSWTPGETAATHDVYLGTSFDDVNNASRSNPLDVLVSEGQADAAYQSPAVLEFGQTYYWRIDEVNAAPDFTIFKGEVWSFTVEPFAYPIAGVVASDSVSGTAGDAQNAVNGSGLNANDEHSTRSEDMWLAMGNGVDLVWIQFEFDRVYKLHQALVWNYNVEFEPVLGFGLKDVTVEYSADGIDWTALGDVAFAQATAKPDYVANTTIDFGDVAARFVRFTVSSGFGVLPQYGLSEVRFLYIAATAREPQPADGAVDVAPDAVLSWRAGRGAAAHNVYFGADPEALTQVDTVAESAYGPGPLDFGTTYTWRIDEVNEAEAIPVWQGDLWSFTAQEYAVIDDMESYDDEDNAIFDTWIDGFTNGTSSTVGYFQAPFAEQTIVHGGGQSMPLEYANDAAPFYSEAERDLGSLDLTANGADTLRLFVAGQLDNAPEPFYVALEDTSGNVAVATHPDASLSAGADWIEWLIPYSDFAGVNLSRVAVVYVGVGDRNNPSSGGTGLVFVDDIGYGHSASAAD